MAYIRQLIQSLFDQQTQGNVESFKKLIYLAVNEPTLFGPHALQLANTLCPALQCVDDSTTKIYALQLLAELATNYHSKIPPQSYEFTQVVQLLSDENAQVRKAAHYLLLIFIKKYERIDEIIRGYLDCVKESGQEWKQIQKIIHSFQSLLVIEPRCVTYPHSYTPLDDFLRLIIAFRLHQHALIQKASDQTVSSFVKNQYTPQIVHKLDRVIQGELAQIAQKLGVSFAIKKQSSAIFKEKQQSNEEQDTNELQYLLQSLQGESEWKVKCEIIEEISKRLQEDQHQIPPELVDRMLQQTYDYNFKICITAMNIIYTLINKYPSTVEAKVAKIEEIMIQKICDLKMAVRQIAAKILKKIFNNQTKDSSKRILSKLGNCSVIGKEQILNFMGDYYTIEQPYDLGLVLGEVATQLSNQNTKIKIKTLDCLVKITTSHNLEECKFILSKKLNRVYFDMFLERLKERNGNEMKEEKNKWQDKNANIKKGMTWQAQRSPPVAQTNDRFMTKIQFAKKVQKTVQEEDFNYQAPTFGMNQQSFKGKGAMLGTSHTSQPTHTSYDNQDNRSKISKKTPSDQDNRSKMSKKAPSDHYKSSAYTVDPFEAVEQKKLPLKPKPVKKGAVGNGENQNEESSNLVIHSKEYMNKNMPQEQKGVKKMNLARKKDKEKTQKSQKDRQQQNLVTKQPFSIKKSTSRKQHQIDYKATQYLAKEELAPVKNPKQLLKDIAKSITNSNDWSKQFDSLDGIRRILKNHEQMYSEMTQNLPVIMPEVLKLVQSLRSTLAKNAMITLSEMCQALQKSMDPFLEGIFTKLFKKAQDTNTFIIQQVNKCIKSLCNYCSPLKIANIVTNNSQAKAVPIKIKVVLCIERLLVVADYSIGLLKQHPKLLAVLNNYIVDGSQEVRGNTREIFTSILGNNSGGQVQGMFRKTSNWQKWRTIIQKDSR